MKLTVLEQQAFQELLTAKNRIESIMQQHSDSINDFTCNQFTITTDEPMTLKNAQESIADVLQVMEPMLDKIEVLHKHFSTKE